MAPHEYGHAALSALDAVLAERPRKDDHGLTHAMQCLTRFRDEVIAIQREDPPSRDRRETLSRLNAVVAVVFGAHFPLGTVPWAEVEKARGWLRDLVREFEGEGAAG
ncbi:hypothetical protein M446_5831 [Methylobacterium sp. 4-46]|uniref:hypothetical protein n=1 Tax=unclassified Methylobacterium TaxID=2615210 RepID=UPI000152DAEB|nr:MULTISPECIES: hypothetical protein [Methylobacterium]ACA20118.1 hypothetical protein M446_5831 [Methylobacterium sp. 4-46]WFT79299.1 hypothetical protein QA634_29425 [Methylobacterium nodulans]